MVILQIIEYILKFLAQIIFGILKVFAWVIDATGLTNFSETMQNPNEKTIFEAADGLKTVEQEERGESGEKF